MGQPVDGRAQRALRREGAYVHLVNDVLQGRRKGGIAFLNWFGVPGSTNFVPALQTIYSGKKGIWRVGKKLQCVAGMGGRERG